MHAWQGCHRNAAVLSAARPSGGAQCLCRHCWCERASSTLTPEALRFGWVLLGNWFVNNRNLLLTVLEAGSPREDPSVVES